MADKIILMETEPTLRDAYNKKVAECLELKKELRKWKVKNLVVLNKKVYQLKYFPNSYHIEGGEIVDCFNLKEIRADGSTVFYDTLEKRSDVVKSLKYKDKEINKLKYENEQLKEENKRLYEALHADNVMANVLYSMPDPQEVEKVYKENKKLKAAIKILKEKGICVEVLTDKLKDGTKFQHLHLAFQCNCLETITKEEYELINEVLNA